MSAFRERVLRDVLNVSASDVSPAWVLGLAERSLGVSRSALAVDLVRGAPLCKRGDLLADLAALSVGTAILGEQWWSQPTPARLLEAPPTGPTPDQHLAGHPVREVTFGPIDYLALMIAESAAAPTTLCADLNFPVYTGVVPVPDGANLGDRFPVFYDYGARVDAVVTTGEDGALVTKLDLDSAGYSTPANVAWAVSLTLGQGRHLLPGEEAGTDIDPYLAPMPADAADLDLLEMALKTEGRPHAVRSVGDGVDVIAMLDPFDLHDISQAIWRLLAGQPWVQDLSMRHLREKYGAPGAGAAGNEFG